MVADAVAVNSVTGYGCPEADLSNFSLDLLCSLGLDGYFKHLNPAWEKTLGFSIEELLAKPLIEWLHPEDRQATIDLTEKLKVGITTISFENRYLCKDGSYKWLLWTAAQLTEGGAIHGLARDITSRKHAEAALLESEERFRIVADTAPLLIWVAGRDKLCSYFNKVWLEFTGRTLEQEMGNGWTEGVHPDDLQLCLNIYITAFDAREAFRMEYRRQRADGEYRWILDTGNPRFMPDGSFAGYIGSCIDITERKQAEEALQESEKRYQALTEVSPVGIFHSDALGCCLYVNERWSAIAGFSAQDALGEGWVGAIHPDDRDRVFADWNHAVKENLPFKSKYRFWHPDGTTTWVFGQAVAQKAKNGEVTGYVGTITDISESRSADTLRKQAEAEQLATGDRIKLLLESTGEGIYGIDLQGRCTFINKAAGEMLGYQPEEVMGKNMHSLIHHSRIDGSFYSSCECPIYCSFDKGRSCRVDSEVLWRRDGTCFPAEYSSYPIRNGEAIEGAVVTFMNISDRKRTMEELRKLHRAVEQSPSMVLITDRNGFVEYANPRLIQMTGLTYEEVIGTNAATLGEQSPEHIQELGNTISDCGEWRGEFYNKKKNGEYYWEMASVSPVFNEQQEITHFVKVAEDITSRKLAEQALKQANENLEIRVQERTAELRKALQRLEDEMANRQQPEEQLKQAKEELEKSYSLLQGVIEGTPDHIFVKDLQGRYVLLNSATALVFGKPVEEIIGKKDCELVPPEVVSQVRETDNTILRTGVSQTLEEVVQVTDSMRTYLSTKSVYRDKEGNVIGLIGIARDITSRKKTEAALRESDLRLNSIISSLQDLVWSISASTFEVLFMNQIVDKLYGRPSSEFFDNPNLWLEVIHPEDRDRALEYNRRIMQEGSGEMEYRIIRTDGHVRWVHTRAWLIYDENGTAIRMDGLTSDITERKQSEKIQARLTGILEATTDFVGTVDSNGNILYINRAGRKMLGLSEDEDISTRHISDLYAPSTAEIVLACGVPAAIKDGVWSGETTLQYRNGQEMPVSQVIMSHKGENGEVEFISTIARDITPAKQAEEALRQSEARLAEAQKVAHVGSWEFDLATGEITWSEELFRVWGMEPTQAVPTYEELLQKIHPDDREVFVKALNLAITEGKPYEFDHRSLRPDGSIGYMFSKGQPILNSQGQVIKLLGIGLDISDRKRGEEAVRHREEQLRQILQNMPVMMTAFDADGNLTVWNRECERVIGYSALEIVGNPQALELVYPDPAYRASMLTLWAELGNNYRNWEWEITAKDGSVKTIAWSNISDELPIPGWATWGIGVDVTERKQAEEALAEKACLAAFRADVDTALTQSDRLQGILQRCTEAVVQHIDAAFVRIWTLNSEDNVLELQASAGLYTHIDGSHSRVPVGQLKIGLIAQECQPHLSNCVMEDPRVGDKDWAKREGLISFAGYPLIIEGQILGVIAMFARKSLTEATLGALEFAADEIALGVKRKQAEEALRHSEARFRQLAQREALLNRLSSDVRNSLDVNTILGTAVQEIRNLLQIDRCMFVWYRPSSSEQPVWDVVKEAKIPAIPSFLGQFPAVANAITHKFIHLELLRAEDLITATDPAEHELYTAQGYTAILSLPIQTPSNNIGVLSCAHHSGPRPWSNNEVELLQAVTDQLAIALFQAELYTQAQEAARLAQHQAQQRQLALQQLQQTQAQLIQSEKMSSLGQMVAGVAHEINNPVNFIHGNLTYVNEYTQDLLNLLHLYQQNYPNPVSEIRDETEAIDLDFLVQDLPKILASMKMGTDRIRQIVLSLRNFSRLDEADMKAVDIHEGIDSSLLILQNRLKANGCNSAIQIVKEYGNLPLVDCYAGQINQVFMNILNNAIDALENQPAPRAIAIHTELKDRDRVLIRIQDNGPGMTEAVRSRLFDPFFTTKPVGKGTGLGLSISYQIVVEKHGGVLKCFSQPGGGAEFSIEIPIFQREA